MYTVEQIRVGMNISKKELANALGIHVNSYNNKIECKTPWLLDEAVTISKLSGHDINQIQFTK
jgi:plasmid maintenance system antidote protein VapI